MGNKIQGVNRQLRDKENVIRQRDEMIREKNIKINQL